MSVATAEPAQWRLFEGAAEPEPRLDRVIASRWEELSAHRSVDCPLCGAALRPEYGPHARPVGGRCEGCGSSLR